jgi:hypothetical protein
MTFLTNPNCMIGSLCLIHEIIKINLLRNGNAVTNKIQLIKENLDESNNTTLAGYVVFLSVGKLPHN